MMDLECAVRRHVGATIFEASATSNPENPAHPTDQEFVTGRPYLGPSPTSHPLTLQKAMHGLMRRKRLMAAEKDLTHA